MEDGDRAWRDLDADGVQDAGEPGFPGVTFILRSAPTSAVVAGAVSDLSGTYYFSGVPAGAYTIEVVPLPGFGATLLDVGSDALDSDFDDTTLATSPFTFVNGNFNIDCGLKTVDPT